MLDLKMAGKDLKMDNVGQISNLSKNSGAFTTQIINQTCAKNKWHLSINKRRLVQMGCTDIFVS